MIAKPTQISSWCEPFYTSIPRQFNNSFYTLLTIHDFKVCQLLFYIFHCFFDTCSYRICILDFSNLSTTNQRKKYVESITWLTFTLIFFCFFYCINWGIDLSYLSKTSQIHPHTNFLPVAIFTPYKHFGYLKIFKMEDIMDFCLWKYKFTHFD
jgi:hypothetical protein